MDENLHSLSDRFHNWRAYLFFSLGLTLCFVLGLLDRAYREKQFQTATKSAETYLNRKIELEGRVITYPVPSVRSYSYVLETKNGLRVQLNSKTYQSPEKGDSVKVQTKLYAPKFMQQTQKIKGINAYGTVHGDRNFQTIKHASTWGTQLREHIFAKAQRYLNAQNYGYYRAMVFGDQAMLGQKAIDRLKETGLLHLFVVSGSHILFACGLGFWILRLILSWFSFFHRHKTFISLLQLGSIFFVFGFLYLINPPISSFRAVGTMLVFVGLNWIRRPQHPLWNLGIIFFATVIYNPIYLFDISTQLTFASVAGILCFSHLLKRYTQEMELSRLKSYLLSACAATLGAGLFTLPILYLQFGTFYPMSLLYNLVLATTLGSLVSFLSVASLVWSFFPIEFLNKIGFFMLDFLFEYFEKILFWRSPFEGMSIGNPGLSSISGLWWIWVAGTAGVAFIIAQHFFKKRIFFK